MPFRIDALDTTVRPDPLVHWKPWKRYRLLERLTKYVWYRFAKPVYSIRRITIDSDSIRELILKSNRSIQLLTRYECKHIIVGYKQAQQLREDVHMLSWPDQVSIYRNDGKLQIYGFTVHCVPWFDGILLLPDLESKQHVLPRQ